MKTLITIAASLLLLVSCEKANKDKGKEGETVQKNDSTATAKSEPTTADNSGKPALNPEHGQPHHRCDIEVGAPLDSAPTQQNTAPQPAPASVFNTNPVSAPAQTTSSSTSVLQTGAKPALNPEHGQPHHRCDIAVGAPLS